MKTEYLIRAANPVRTTDLPGGDSPAARRILDQIRAQATPAVGRTRRFHRIGRRTLATERTSCPGTLISRDSVP